MGENKNWVDFDGEPMLRAVLRRHFESGINRAIVCYVDDESQKQLLAEDEKEKDDLYNKLGEGLPWTFQTWQEVEEISRENGGVEDLTIRHPLYGIYGVLSCATREENCSLAILTSNDVPILDPKLAGVLASHLDKNSPGVMAGMPGGRPAPLLSVVRPQKLLNALKTGYQETMVALSNGKKTESATKVLLNAGVEVIPAEILISEGIDMSRLAGANTPEELEGLKCRWIALNF